MCREAKQFARAMGKQRSRVLRLEKYDRVMDAIRKQRIEEIRKNKASDDESEGDLLHQERDNNGSHLKRNKTLVSDGSGSFATDESYYEEGGDAFDKEMYQEILELKAKAENARKTLEAPFAQDPSIKFQRTKKILRLQENHGEELTGNGADGGSNKQGTADGSVSGSKGLAR